MNTAIHLTEFYQEVLGPSEFDCVSVDFRTPDFEFTIEFSETREGRFFNVCNYDESAVDIAITERLKVLASNTRLMLIDDGSNYVELQTAIQQPRDLVDQTLLIAEAIDADRFAVVNVQLRTLDSGGLLEQVAGRLVRAGLLDRRSVSYQRV